MLMHLWAIVVNAKVCPNKFLENSKYNVLMDVGGRFISYRVA